jgi:hypothetical protein
LVDFNQLDAKLSVHFACFTAPKTQRKYLDGCYLLKRSFKYVI